MKNTIKLLFSVLVLFTGIMTGKAYDITKDGNKNYLSFENEYSTKIDAENAVEEFKNYVLSKNGIIINTNTTKKTYTTTNLIATGTLIEKDTDAINNSLQAIKDNYQDTDNTTYIVENDDIVTINGEDESLENEDKTVLENHVKELEDEGWTVVASYSTRTDVVGRDTVNIDETFDSYIKANLYKEDIISHYQYTDLTYTDESYFESSTENIDKTFESKQDALDYINSLGDEYTINEYTISQANHQISVSLDETFDTEEQAQNALNEFLGKYSNSNGNVSSVRDTEEDETTSVNGETAYETRDEAQAAADALEKDTDEEKIEATIRENTETIITDRQNIESEQFSTEEEALNYINSLRQQGYNVDDLETQLVSFEESTWTTETGVVVDPGQTDSQQFNYGHFDVTVLNTFTSIDTNGNESTVTGTMTVESVKINGNTITMTGPATDPNTGLSEYASKTRFGLNVNNSSYVVITGNVIVNGTSLPYSVEGYLSESQNVCGGRGYSKGFDLEFNSVKIVNQKVLIDTNLVSQYIVKGEIYKETPKTTYYVDYTKTTKGYDYNVVAEGIDTVYDNIFNLQATVTKKTKVEQHRIKGTAANDITVLMNLLDLNKSKQMTNYNVFEIVTSDTYLASGNGYYTDSIVPKTGVNGINYTKYLVLVLLVFAGINVRFMMKNGE